MRATRAALRYFRDAGHGGVIVNNAWVLGWRAQEWQAHYAAAKAGVMALTRCSALEAVAARHAGQRGVPEHRAMHPFLAKVTSDELLDRAHPERGVRPGRRAVGGRRNVMVFLASDYASYLTGEVISVSSQRA